jgi:hypothetical protein
MTDSFNIKEAAQISGLTASVLRVWEFRYGWPSPKRARNGYRAFTKAQVEDLCRAARLVKNGMSVSQLIVDGFPRWPASELPQDRPRHLVVAKDLPAAPSPAAAALRDDVVTCLDRLQGGRVEQILQAAPITARPRDELHGVLLPVLVGLAELTAQNRQLPDAARIHAQISSRLAQLVRRIPGTVQVVVVPGDEHDLPAAHLAALLLSDLGRPAQVASAPAAGLAVLHVGQAAHDGISRVGLLPIAGRPAIADLVGGRVVASGPVRLAG